MPKATNAQPRLDRPSMPSDYFLPGQEAALLPWSWAVERLERAREFWFSTTRRDGRPHAVPAWGVWLDGALYFEGSPVTQRARNLARNPTVSIHLESATEVVILEGDSRAEAKPGRSLAGRLAAIFAEKYGESHDYRPEASQWDAGGLWSMTPRVAFGWTDFPRDVTRWRFER